MEVVEVAAGAHRLPKRLAIVYAEAGCRAAGEAAIILHQILILSFMPEFLHFQASCTCVRCAPVTWLKPTCSRSSSSCLSLPIFLSWTPELARQAARLNLACTRCQLNPRRSQEETPTQSGNAEAPPSAPACCSRFVKLYFLDAREALR